MRSAWRRHGRPDEQRADPATVWRAADRGYAPSVTDATDRALLIAAAASARNRSYAPYSDFHMGAAVQCADGTFVPGSLVENVSLGLAMCAERAALFTVVAQGLSPVALALVSKRTSGELTFPCGACLQVAMELAGPELVVVAADPDGACEERRLAELLVRAPHRLTYRPADGDDALT